MLTTCYACEFDRNFSLVIYIFALHFSFRLNGSYGKNQQHYWTLYKQHGVKFINTINKWMVFFFRHFCFIGCDFRYGSPCFQKSITLMQSSIFDLPQRDFSLPFIELLMDTYLSNWVHLEVRRSICLNTLKSQSCCYFAFWIKLSCQPQIWELSH